MSFIHPALLSGLILVGLPVLLHLILRQQPKRLIFPAFRFLARKATSNRRRMRLRHLLLLLLRMALIAVMCLALARPRALNLGGDQPVAAVFIIDTSLSMGYELTKKSALDEAKERALEVLARLPKNSQVAVFDTAEPGLAWLDDLATAEARIMSRRLRADSGPITNSLRDAYALFAKPIDTSIATDTARLRFIYAFTDRTPACWNVRHVESLIRDRDQFSAPGVQHVLIDVGIEKPTDMALADLRWPRNVVPEHRPLVIPVVIQATGGGGSAVVTVEISDLAGRQPELIELVSDAPNAPAVARPVDPTRSAWKNPAQEVTLEPGQSKEVFCHIPAIRAGFYRATVKLTPLDALEEDNTLYATFEVRAGRPVLIIGEREPAAELLVRALKGEYRCDVRTADAAAAITPADLSKYCAVCLLSVPEPGRVGLWEKLAAYVAGGGGLAVFPGGEETVTADYNRTDGPARTLLPGKLRELVDAEAAGAVWVEPKNEHPLLAPFEAYARMPETGYAANPPRTFRFWDVVPDDPKDVLVWYSGEEPRRPAILQTPSERLKGGGRVLMFSTPFDNRPLDRHRNWNDYAASWFYLALVNKTMQYLAGAAEDVRYTYVAAPALTLPVPPALDRAPLTFSGPGITGTDALVKSEGGSALLTTKEAGHYSLGTPDDRWVASFSVNPPASEFQLLPRVSLKELAPLLGENAVLQPGQTAEHLYEHFRQPMELFPWLMVAVLLLLAGECYLANRFYRNEPATEAGVTGTVT